MSDQTTITIPRYIAVSSMPDAQPHRGWAVFNADDPENARIERYDDLESVPGYASSWRKLEDDKAAWNACVEGALEGDRYCLRALAAVPPGERDQISKETGVSFEIPGPDQDVPWQAEVSYVGEDFMFPAPQSVQYTFARDEAVMIVREATRLANASDSRRHGTLQLPASQPALWVTDALGAREIDDDCTVSEHIEPFGTLAITGTEVCLLGVAKHSDDEVQAGLCSIEALKAAFEIKPDEIQDPKPELYLVAWDDGDVSLSSDDPERAMSAFNRVILLSQPAPGLETVDVFNPVKMTLATGVEVTMSRHDEPIGMKFFDLESQDEAASDVPASRRKSGPR